MIVRGTASDPQGVAKVLVNDLPAELSVGGTASANRNLVIANPFSEPGSSAGDVTAQSTDAMQWRIEVPLNQGENEIEVSVEDGAGEISKRVATVQVEYVEVPLQFDIDVARQRVAGLSFNLEPDGHSARLVQHNYSTNQQTVYPQNIFATSGVCLKGDVDAFYYVTFQFGGYELRRFDLVGLHDSLVVEIPSSFLGSDPRDERGLFVSNLECGAGHAYAYLLVNRGGFDLRKSRILRISLATGAIDILSETESDEPSRWTAWEMALTDTALITLHDINDVQPLMRVDLANGSRSVLTPGLNVGGFDVVPVLDEGVLYVPTFEGIDAIDLATRQRRNISELPGDHPYLFSQIRSAAYDPSSRRIILSDSSLDMLISVDVDTGERSKLLARSVGQGQRLIGPRRLSISRDMTKAYVADDGALGFGKLFEIDLTSGDRRVVGDIATRFSGFASGLAVDEESRRGYVAFDDTILEIHLETEQIVAVASPATPGNRLQAITDMVLDTASERLLVADGAMQAIVSVDPATRLQTVVSQAGTAGAGPTFHGINSLTFAGDPAVLFVSNQTSENIMRVDLATGDRHVELDQCLDEDGSDILGSDETLQQILYDEQSGRLLIMGNHLLSYDPETSQCGMVYRWIAARGVLAVHPGAQDQLFGTVFGAVVGIDVPSREIVIISK